MASQHRFDAAAVELHDERARRWLWAIVALSLIGSISHRLPFSMDSGWDARSRVAPLLGAINDIRTELHLALYRSGSAAYREAIAANASSTQMKAENAKLRAEIEALRNHSKLSSYVGAKGMTAAVISRPFDITEGDYVIDRGSSDGVRAGSVVMAESRGEIAVAGVVREAKTGTATVMSVRDPECRISVVVDGAQEIAIYAGGGSGSPGKLEYLDRAEVVKPGAVVRTAPSSAVFPAGFKVGEVRNVTPGGGRYQEISVVPSAAPEKAYYVWVLGESSEN